MASKKGLILGIAFIVFFFALTFPGISSAISYYTECGEEVFIGACGGKECELCCEGEGDEEVCVPCCPCCTECGCSGSWNEYKIYDTTCGADIYVKHCQSVCTPGELCCSCGGCEVVCSPPIFFKQVENWQKAERSGSCQATRWGLIAPENKCQGECVKTPENPRYYNNPTYPTHNCSPESSINSEDITLPVKLDWDDVEGWKDGWCAGAACSEACVQSYAVRVTTSTDLFSDIADKSEYIPRACLLPSNKTSDWGVKACCNIDGTNCGGESKWNLATNLAPELVSPQDPDWIGSKGEENTSLPVTLDWCDVGEAKSYRFYAYVFEGGKKVCHPSLVLSSGSKDCDSWLLRETWRYPEQTERILFSDFPDENMDFFTKNTDYAWEVKICDEEGFNCEEKSQLWMFSGKNMPLATSFLNFPTNDPAGETPVEFPLTLDWDDKPGVNSFIYEVVPASGGKKISGNTNVSQSKVFDFPELSLNTLYKWKVKSCWDYLMKECEPNFSEEWYFKTTGQAPKLTYPASGEQNVVIPVDFTWEKVPGAKSYIFKISGGLNFEKILDDPKFSIEFPEYPISQETDYSWQVRTCAWEEGQTCGQYSSPQSFKTFRLPPPQNPSPINNGVFFTGDKYISWEKVPGAQAYQYQIKYLSLSEKEVDETCPALAGKELFLQPETVLTYSGFVELKCLGEYQWQIRSCLDENCQETSNWSSSWVFTFLEGGTGQGGLVPCGRANDNPNTRHWNEREECQVKHLVLLIKIIVDFLLLRVIPIIFVILTIYTGLIFYTSLGQMTTMMRVRSLWRAVVIGLGVVFLSWTIVNIFLKLVGYNIGAFGNWYQLPTI